MTSFTKIMEEKNHEEEKSHGIHEMGTKVRRKRKALLGIMVEENPRRKVVCQA